MRKSAGNMFEWIDYTYNPIKGECIYKCNYCYMNKFNLNKIRLDTKALSETMPENKRIMVGSGTDMFANNVPTEWIDKVLSYLKQHNNTYLFHTKNPSRYLSFKEYPEKSIFGVTIETNRQDIIKSNAPTIKERVEAMSELKGIKTITFEPIMKFDTQEMIEIVKKIKPKYVSIGAFSGKGEHIIEPESEQLRQLIRLINHETEVKIKHNLKRIIKQT
jgi:DNA repair photolyase